MDGAEKKSLLHLSEFVVEFMNIVTRDVHSI
jgi:hypothetical protein